MGSKNRLFSRLIRQFNSDLTIKTESLETEAQVTTATVSTQVDSAVAALVEAAPAALDTLDELAAALGDDANFATTVTNSLATKANASDVIDSAGISSIVEGYGYTTYDSSNTIGMVSTVAISGSYSDLDSAPTLFSGSYNDLTDKPEASAGVSVYDSAGLLPLSNNSAGDMAYVTATNKLFLYTGTAWWNVGFTNAIPTAISGNNASYLLATDGTPTVITLTSTDSDGVPLTWTSSSDDIGTTATVTNVDNVFTITPSTSEADDGTFTLTFSASDGENIRTSPSDFTLQIAVPVDYTNMPTGYGSLVANYASVSAANPYINNTTAISNGGSSNNNHITLWMTHSSQVRFRKIRFSAHTSQSRYPFIYIYACPRQNGIADLNNNLLGSYRTNPVTNTINGHTELNLALTTNLNVNTTVTIPANYIFAIVVSDFYYTGRRQSGSYNRLWQVNGSNYLTQFGLAFWDCGGKGTSYIPSQMGGTRTVATTPNIPLLTPTDFF